MSKKIVVQLVTWNGEKYMPFLFDSLKKQTSTDWELLILDNSSEDGTVFAIEKQLEDLPFPVTFYKEQKNYGFVGGHNRLYDTHSADYVVLLNQDMYLDRQCFDTMAEHLDQHAEAAAVSPRLMRWDFAKVETGHLEDSFSEYVDALGLHIFRNRRVVEQYTQERWAADSTHSNIRGLFSKEILPVFGVSGALPMYRNSMLKKACLADGKLFDEIYHAYKEDVDLAYRLQSCGFGSVVLLGVEAFHDRTGAGPRELSDRAASNNKKNQSSFVASNSYKNHLMTLYKNEYWQNMVLDFPHILWYEFKKGLWFLCNNRRVFLGLGCILRNRKVLCANRKHIRQQRNTSWKDIRLWWKKT